jgi:hypothetical protein
MKFLHQTYNFVTMITNFELELYFLVQNDIYNNLLWHAIVVIMHE